MKIIATTHDLTKEPLEPNNCIVQLERSDQTLTQMHKKLCSYKNEPTTTSLFEQSEGLKRRMNTLKKANIEILNSFKQQKQLVKEEIEYVKNQFNAINELQLGIDNYLMNVRKF